MVEGCLGRDGLWVDGADVLEVREERAAGGRQVEPGTGEDLWGGQGSDVSIDINYINRNIIT